MLDNITDFKYAASDEIHPHQVGVFQGIPLRMPEGT